jgi:hypothetical protein
LVGQETEPGYGRPGNGAPSAPPIHRALDLQA